MRGAALRALLGIDDNSVLRARTLRDHIEHLDERLDAWAEAASAEDCPALYVRVMLPEAPATSGLDPAHCFLYFDARALTITFAGEPFDILPISWAVHALAEKVATILAQPLPA